MPSSPLEPQFHASAPSGEYEHIGEAALFPGPQAEISRDRNLTWWRRILPVLLSHKLTFVGAVTFSFVSLIFQTLVPKLLMGAIDRLTPGHHQPIQGIVIAVLAIGLLAGISGYLSRRFLFTTAYNGESDLRNLMYEHLTWLSFSFYDRVQSGQLISRANSDIRSVQMYFTFAPQIIVQCGIGIIAFGFMLSINVTLALIAMITMPLLYFV